MDLQIPRTELRKKLRPDMLPDEPRVDPTFTVEEEVMTDSRAHDKMTRLGLGYRTGTQAFTKALTDTPKQASQRRMIAYLHDEAEGLTAWEQEFVESLHRRADSGLFFMTDKQDKILTDLFERH